MAKISYKAKINSMNLNDFNKEENKMTDKECVCNKGDLEGCDKATEKLFREYISEDKYDEFQKKFNDIVAEYIDKKPDSESILR